MNFVETDSRIGFEMYSNSDEVPMQEMFPPEKMESMFLPHKTDPTMKKGKSRLVLSQFLQRMT